MKGKSCNDLLSKYRGALMGLSIIFIILFHFVEDCQSYEYHYEGWIRWFRVYVGSSSVDTFLFLSGLGLYYSMKKSTDAGQFYRRRFSRILVPYVIIALPSWILYDMVIKERGVWDVIRDFTFLSFFDEGIKWYWYIILILFCYLIYPYVFQIVDSARDAIDGEIRLLSMISAFTVMALVLQSGEKEAFSHLEIALLRLPIFLAGCFYGRSSFEKRKSYWKWGILFGLSTACVLLLPTESVIFGRYVLGLFNISSCAILAWIFSKVSCKPLIHMLEWFGTYSLELYVSHVTVRRFMREMGYQLCYVRYELIMVASSIVLAWLLNRLVQLLQKRVAHR